MRNTIELAVKTALKSHFSNDFLKTKDIIIKNVEIMLSYSTLENMVFEVSFSLNHHSLDNFYTLNYSVLISIEKNCIYVDLSTMQEV